MGERGAGSAVGRRALLTLGAAVLVTGCAPTGSGTSRSAPPGGGSGSAPATSAGAASAGTTSAGTTGSVCPTAADVIPKPHTEQYLPCSGKDIALTIDDGPHPVWTPQVLAVLARLDVRATFCMIGQNAARHPELVARVVDAGHQVANHTYTHPTDLAKWSRTQVDGQIGRTTDVLTQASRGQAPRLFRAPGGAWSAAILASATSAGLRPLDWSVDTRDWSRPGVSHIVDVIVTKTRPGSIILDHDGGGNREQTVTALGIALPRLLDQGYRFVMP